MISMAADDRRWRVVYQQSLARLGAHTLAVDASAENVGVAARHAAADPGLAALAFRHASAEVLVQEPKRFDVVCSMEVIEHVDNPAAFLRSCAELVKVSERASSDQLTRCASGHKHTYSHRSADFFFFFRFSSQVVISFSRRSLEPRSLISLRS
jgi:SAM-dependent methyltransferase